MDGCKTPTRCLETPPNRVLSSAASQHQLGSNAAMLLPRLAPYTAPPGIVEKTGYEGPGGVNIVGTVVDSNHHSELGRGGREEVVCI